MRIVAEGEHVRHIIDQRVKARHLALRRLFLRPSIVERGLAEGDGPVQRADELGREALHGRVCRHGETVREQLRGGQHIAQFVVDLGHSKAKGGHAAALFQHFLKGLLQRAKLILGNPQLIPPPRWCDQAVPVDRISPEMQDRLGHPPHGPHKEGVQGEIDQKGCEP